MPIERLSGGEIVVKPEWYFPEELKTYLGGIGGRSDRLELLGSKLGEWMGLGYGGGLSPVLLPGFGELVKTATTEAEKLASRFIGAGVGFTPQFRNMLLGDILRGFYREAMDIYLSRLLELGKLLTEVEKAKRAGLLDILGFGKLAMPEVYIPAPTETTQIVKEEKPWWGYLLSGLGTGLGALLAG